MILYVEDNLILIIDSLYTRDGEAVIFLNHLGLRLLGRKMELSPASLLKKRKRLL